MQRPRREDPAADLDLVQRALRGDREARQDLLTRLACIPRIVRGLNRRMARPFSSADCEDVVQAALTAVWTKLDRYRPERSLEAWLYGFAWVELRKRVERRDRDGRLELRDDEEEWAGSEADRLDPALEYERLHRALDGLRARVAEVIRLHHFDELTFQEIAERTGAPRNTVKTHYYRGLQALRRVLEGPGREEVRR